LASYVNSEVLSRSFAKVIPLADIALCDTYRGAGLVSKAGPIKTDQDFFIVDAPFPQLLIASDVAAGKDGSGKNGVWEVQALAKAIKQIAGVLEVGIFAGLTGPEATKYGVKGGQKPVACYFGMQDGTVTIRKAPSKNPADLKDAS
jgi:ribose 5-phosphate isomerase